MSRQIILDTETTGLDYNSGHRVIEIGAIEMLNRRLTGNNFHVYINPERAIEAEALSVHGIDSAFLADKPVFAAILEDFLNYINAAELIIHNAPFDVGFLNHEMKLCNKKAKPITDYASVFDTLALARRKHPGQRNNLDALCKRYNVNNSKRDLHGALLDANLLAEVYLAMTGGQTSLFTGGDLTADETQSGGDGDATIAVEMNSTPKLRVALPITNLTPNEEAAHAAYLAAMEKSSGGKCLWSEQNNQEK